MTPQEISLLVYNIALLPVMFLSILFLFFTILNLFIDRENKPARARAPAKETAPFITVQIPSFNDPVALRCVEACLRFNYPRSRYEIMILDDSTAPQTQRILRQVARKNKGLVSYIHRTNREGYKPGALRDAHHKIKGEFIVIFDADFLPDRNFLQKIMVPFSDPKVAIVQSRQGFSNSEANLVSKFAAYLLMTYHTIIMPINNKTNTVFFCGTAGAIRKSALEKAGGWNARSITEDSDLSVKILSMGYKSVYLKFETKSEVPTTIEAFVKQQMRWTFGNIRVFIDHARDILLRRGLTLRQRIMISFLTLSSVIAPAVILMTIAGFSGWFLGDPKLFEMSQILEFIIKFFYTSGFLLMAIITLYKRRTLREFPQLLLATMTVSIVLAVANTLAVYRAIFMKDKPLFSSKRNSWICTPKSGNQAYVKAIADQ